MRLIYLASLLVLFGCQSDQYIKQNGITYKIKTIHTVKEGETIWGIADSYYGDGLKWFLIKQANINNVNVAKDLKIGMKIIIPDKEHYYAELEKEESNNITN